MSGRPPPLEVVSEGFPERAAFDTAVSRALLEEVAVGERPATLRLYRPGDIMAFSLLDRRRDGFPAAVAAARRDGFAPVLRLTGGRAALFHGESLAFGWCLPVSDGRQGIAGRFDALAGRLRAALAGLGLDVRIGEVPGEYCPGDHSLNIGGRYKVAGLGQRVVRGAAYVGGVLTLGDSARLRAGLAPVYAALEYPFEAERAGSLADALPGIGSSRVRRAILDAFADDWEPRPAALAKRTLQAAEVIEERHRVGPDGASAVRPLGGKVLAGH